MPHQWQQQRWPPLVPSLYSFILHPLLPECQPRKSLARAHIIIYFLIPTFQKKYYPLWGIVSHFHSLPPSHTTNAHAPHQQMLLPPSALKTPASPNLEPMGFAVMHGRLHSRAINCQPCGKAVTNKGDLAQRDAEGWGSLVRSGDQSRGFNWEGSSAISALAAAVLIAF